MRRLLAALTILTVFTMAPGVMASTPVSSGPGRLVQAWGQMAGEAPTPVGRESRPELATWLLLMAGLAGLAAAGSRADRLRPVSAPASVPRH